MVERNLAKVEVASSRLVSRSKSKGFNGWRDSKVVMHRIANPLTAVRFRLAPPKMLCEGIKNAGVAQLVERNLAKVEVASSRLVSRSKIWSVSILFDTTHLQDAGVAQLVERNLAKVEVASSRLVSRSKFPPCQIK